MIRIPAWRTCALLAGFCLASCDGGAQRVAGGGATETGNGVVLRVLSGTGHPAPLADVTFVRTDSWIQDLSALGSPRILIAKADVDGIVILDSLPAGQWAVQGEWSGQRGLVPMVRTDSTHLLRLGPSARVDGDLFGDTSAVVWVKGTAWRSDLDSHLGFRLRVAPGRLSLVAASHGDAVQIAVVNALAIGTQILQDTLAKRRIVLEDFSEGDHTTTVSHYTGLGGWYTASDPGTRIFSTSYPATADFRGQLEMQYTSKDTASGYAIAGIAFISDTTYRNMDLTTMDSLCFDQRGLGQNTVLLQHVANGQIGSQAIVWAGNLSSTWTRFCVTPTSAGTIWSTMNTQTNNISFSATHGNRLELRNIELWGVPLQKLFP